MPKGSQDHSDKNQPLFKQEPVAGSPRISLRDYISQHLNEETAQPEASTPAPKTFQPTAPSAAPSPGLVGQRLNSLDVELGAGLEQYLPTPLFRLRVIKKRLSGEIEDLRAKLNKYERLAGESADMQKRIQAMQSHLRTLEKHHVEVDAELALYLSERSPVYPLIQLFQAWQEAFGKVWHTLRQGMIRLFHGRTYTAIENANAELVMLKDLFAERLGDPQASEKELSQLLNRFEQTLHDLEGRTRQIKDHQLFFQR